VKTHIVQREKRVREGEKSIKSRGTQRNGEREVQKETRGSERVRRENPAVDP